MSKLSENLKAYSTGNRYAKPPTLNCVSFKEASYEIAPYSLQYNLECVVKTSFLVNQRDDAHALQGAISKSKRAILEEIFGEFRTDLYKLDVALYDQDFVKAKGHLEAVMKNMFDY